MNNNLYWKHIDDSEERLLDEKGNCIAYLIKQHSKKWLCSFSSNEYNLSFYYSTDGIGIDEARWKATVWIAEECSKIANSFSHMIKILPSLYDLYDKYAKNIE